MLGMDKSGQVTLSMKVVCVLCKCMWMKKGYVNEQDMYEMKKGSMCEEGRRMEKACVEEKER